MATEIGGRIREARTRLGLSQAELCRGLPVSVSYVSLIESGRRRPRHRVLQVLAERLGCTVEYLTTGRGPEVNDLTLDVRFAELALKSGDTTLSLERFTAAYERSAELGYHAERLEALWGMSRAREALGQLTAAIDGLEQLAAAATLPAVVSRVSVMTALCIAYANAGDLTRAVDVGETALRHMHSEEQIAPGEQAAQLVSTLVGCYHRRGDLTRAHILSTWMVQAAEKAGTPLARAAAYWNAALVAESRGDLRSARSFTERALALYAETDHQRMTSQLRVNAAWLAMRSPEPDLAGVEEGLRRALSDLRLLGSPVDIASAETELARCLLLSGDPTTAEELASAAVDRLRDGPELALARALAVHAHTQFIAGRASQAMRSYERAAATLSLSGPSREAAEVWRELGEAMFATGRTEAGAAAYRRIADALGVPAAADRLWELYGRAAAGTGDASTAP